MRSCKGLDNDPVYLGMRLVGKIIPCLLDAGCDVTLVPQYITEKHKSIRMTPVNRYLQAANDTDIEITGEVTLPLMLNDQCIMTLALVSPDVDELMLGANWLYDHKCIWDFANRRISIDGCAAVRESQWCALRCRHVVLQDDAVLPSRHGVNVTARSPILAPHLVQRDRIIDSCQVRPVVYVGRTLYRLVTGT